jgi:hypothetical protein
LLATSFSCKQQHKNKHQLHSTLCRSRWSQPHNKNAFQRVGNQLLLQAAAQEVQQQTKGQLIQQPSSTIGKSCDGAK